MKRLFTAMIISTFAVSAYASDYGDMDQLDQALEDLQKNAELYQLRLTEASQSIIRSDEDVDVSEQFIAKSNAEKRNSKWEYKQGYDEVEDDVITFSYLVSDNEEDTGYIYGKQKAAILIRNVHDTGFLNDEIFIGFDEDGQVDVCIDSCWLRVRFDDKPAKWYKAEYESPALYTIASSPDYINENATLKYDDDFLLNIYNSKRMLVKLPVFSGGEITYRFNLKGLDESKMGTK